VSPAHPALAYQATFENHRRWLTWDLLCGHVDRGHALWNYLRANGGSARQLDWLRRNACPPDVVGINHYVTSNRILDERVDRFPDHYRGGNGRHIYADVDAVRVLPESATAWGELIDQAWQRYRLPIAITEVHIGCTREEQMRWLYQAWGAALDARNRAATSLQ
jgi:dTDP-4-dehydrorhamnose reductase